MVFLGFSHFPMAKMMLDLRWKSSFRVFQEADGSDALNDDTFGDATSNSWLANRGEYMV